MWIINGLTGVLFAEQNTRQFMKAFFGFLKKGTGTNTQSFK
jgi:hypothetical protein